METELKYTSALTGAAFMFYEFKQVAILKEAGLSDTEIRKKVIDENLFQHEKISSLKRGLPYVLRRVNALDETLRNMVIEDSNEVGKTINLYAIMKTNRLFYEFMEEVIYEKFQLNNYSLEKKDLNTFFTMKMEQNENIAKWTEETIKKLKHVHSKILIDMGMLKNMKSGELNRIIMDERVKNHLTDIGDSKYVHVIGE
ncbi:DUF1819 family protein [Planococcus sp. CP5-4]|nr:DUF1819 family protein [Planococcus sp. CP5-4_YE]MBV0909870.1 DUF1819 family protein [Planococcus sp. CP5-4_UN]MBW6064750.1 DUF1819 family protein [Planococcus sp. CP5-4]